MVVVDSSLSAQTERLLIRPLVIEDAEDVNLMRSHPEVMKHTSVQSALLISILNADHLFRQPYGTRG